MKVTTFLIPAVLASLVISIVFTPAAVAAERPSWAGGGGGSGTDATPASIELIKCSDSDSMVAKWRDGGSLRGTIYYEIVNMSGESQSVIDAVEAGVNEWDASGVYTLEPASTSDTADITIEVYKKVTPGYILGYAVPECSSDGHLSHVYIALGVSGLKTNGVVNLSAHEVGHGLGLKHADLGKDLMGPSLDSTERKNLSCLSNLDVGALAAETSTYSVTDWSCHA